MNLETMGMDTRVARIHYLDYQKKVREHREERKKEAERLGKEAASDLAKTGSSEAGRELHRIRVEKSRLEREDEELMKAYRAMSLGERIININSVFLKCGLFHETLLPKFALAGADWKDCHFFGNAWSKETDMYACRFQNGRWPDNKKTSRIDLPLQAFPAEITNVGWREERKKDRPSIATYPVKAMVPSIPAHLRPAGDLADYHILWEADWKPEPPVDPLLLKKVGEFTYAILAQWDLTPIERSILTGRLT